MLLAKATRRCAASVARTWGGGPLLRALVSALRAGFFEEGGARVKSLTTGAAAYPSPPCPPAVLPAALPGLLLPCPDRASPAPLPASRPSCDCVAGESASCPKARPAA
jgi:hypothetical protein